MGHIAIIHARSHLNEHFALPDAGEAGAVQLGPGGGKLPGEVAGVEIERERGRWLYEFRVVDAKGRLYEVYIDAGTGEIERIREK